MRRRPANIVLLSGGKDSTAMFLMMLERGIPVDEVITLDTGRWAPPEIRRHVSELEQRTGVPITRLTPPRSFDYWMFRHRYYSRKYRRWHTGYGWPTPRVRWCTKLKYSTWQRYLRERYGDRAIVNVGLAADERARAEKPTLHQNRYRINVPLIPWGVTEAQCLEYCYRRGYYFGGYYTIHPRESCFCCPMSRLSELRATRILQPRRWERMLDMERRSPTNFRAETSLLDLDRRFAADGKTPCRRREKLPLWPPAVGE